MNRLLAFAVLISLALPALSSTSITYQGQLQQQGQPFTGTADLEFELFDAETDGNALGDQLPRPNWPVENGLFQVALDFGAGAFDGSARYLEVRVNGIALQPRQPIRPAPMALYALSGAGESPWQISGSNLFYPTGRVAIGMESPQAGLDALVAAGPGIRGTTSGSGNFAGVWGRSTATSGTNFGVYGQSASTSGYGVYGWASADAGAAYGVLGLSTSTSGFGVYGWAAASSGTNYGVRGQASSPDGFSAYFAGVSGSRNYFERRVGIGTQSPEAELHAVGSDSTAIIGQSTSGHGVVGQVTAASGLAFGVRGESASTAGRGVYGRATADSGATYGVRGESSSTAGRGVSGVAIAESGENSGVEGYSASSSGSGMYGLAFAGSGTTYGAQGISFSTAGRGVRGLASATTGAAIGVRGESFSTSGRGVDGHATANSGTTTGVYGTSDSNAGRGVLGWATASSGTTYGVRGIASSTDGWGVWAQGRLGASGTKSFRIDHPLDPENQYLLHYSSESPEPVNFYRGRAELDAYGEAWVELPDYFEAINRDAMVQLTAVGVPMPYLHAATEVVDGRFQIAGGEPGARVNWRVEAVRDDLWVQSRGAARRSRSRRRPTSADFTSIRNSTICRPSSASIISIESRGPIRRSDGRILAAGARHRRQAQLEAQR